jgi:di/tricarboxylate transporter
MDQLIVFLALLLALVLFIQGRFRHDLVALGTLCLLVLSGIIPAGDAFRGFGHPAVITVAAVLVVGKALEYSGLIEVLSRLVLRLGPRPTLQILAMCILVALASAFMNNVGALAIMMPIAIHIAGKSGYPPSRALMPIAFASLLGGMTTLVGTPPNIIVASIREDLSGQPFGMFDYMPVGWIIAVSGVLYLGLLGWRILPRRAAQRTGIDLFSIEDYVTEVEVPAGSPLVGKSIGEVEQNNKEELRVLGLVRHQRHRQSPPPDEEVAAGDILILETEAETLRAFMADQKVLLVGDPGDPGGKRTGQPIYREVIVTAQSPLIGQSASGLRMRERYGINLLAVARAETRISRRLDHIRFQNGDVLLLQGLHETLSEVIRLLGCLPLAPRDLGLGSRRRIVQSLGIFGLSIAAVVSGLMPVQLAFTLAAMAMVIANLIPLKEIYTSIDWPVIVLLAAMIPVGEALEATGGAAMLAGQLLGLSVHLPLWGTLTLVLLFTMFLSDVINNAATVVLMAPIGIGVAQGLGVSADPFLMAVALGGSSAFLTPIGHQSNTLVMGPGGYRFSDYWRMGLPLEILITLIGVPLILYYWPA